MTTGLLLFAHGARDARWAAPFAAVAERLRRAAPLLVVDLAFLELMAPALPEAGARMAAAGCTRVDIVPLFLGAGGHVRRDLPELVDRLRAAHAVVEWVLHPAVGEQDEVVEAMARAALRFAGVGPDGDRWKEPMQQSPPPAAPTAA